MNIFLNYFKNNYEMKHIIKIAICCSSLLEMGILHEFLRKQDFKYIFLSILLLGLCFLLLISSIIYDFFTLKHIEYILYRVNDTDTISNICIHFLPQCNENITWKLIKTKNNLCENSIHKGQKLLVPSIK